jgi:FtsZ-binding cell division protein ZapB
MKKTKEQLQADYDRLADRHADLQNDLYDVKKERDKLREDNEQKDEFIDNLMCQIHFLA